MPKVLVEGNFETLHGLLGQDVGGLGNLPSCVFFCFHSFLSTLLNNNLTPFRVRFNMFELRWNGKRTNFLQKLTFDVKMRIMFETRMQASYSE